MGLDDNILWEMSLPGVGCGHDFKIKSKQDQFTLDQKTADSEDRSKFMSAMQTAAKQLKTQDLPQTILNKESFILDGTASSPNQTLKLLLP